MARVSTRSFLFFRLSPAEQINTLCFGVEQGKILQRADVNFWRITPFIEEKLSRSMFPLQRIGNLVSTVQYGCSALASLEPIGVPILRMNNLQNDGWELSNLKYIQLTEDQLNTYKLKIGDLVFNRTNSKELVGKCEVFRESGDWVFASYLIRVRTDEQKLNPQFASDFLNTYIGRLQIDRFSRQIIGMTNINAEEIKQILLPLPPLNKQIELVAAMDEARSHRKQKLAEADALLSSLDDYLLNTLGLKPPVKDERKVFAIQTFSISERFDPHFHTPNFKNIYRLLSKTTTKKLGEVVQFSKDSWNPKDEEKLTFRYIEISNVKPQTGEAIWTETLTKEAPSRARMLVHGDDIIVSLTRPHHGSIAHLSEEFDGCIASTGFAVIRSVSKLVNRQYLWCILRSQISLQQMLQRSSGGNYPAITKTELENIIIPIPEISIQEKIVAEIQHRRSESQRLRSEAETGWQIAKQWFEDQLLGGS
ncbi:MAG: restriction endonuclease subunit S [Microcystis aeruginosa Ma_MB_S_20031200_S102]|uniref:Restriction endonuclease subunit S n=1 Tax=Microcystis aeruginosa Ma_MB_S_20031200_S102 TaxID=2486254 RepID=A0A552EN96_MICAE|nr:MAG: restriction endonuclease subunit S [Microcystis aeruginosa Ma_MB_S_20031200_S102D]TRU35940.1 MAG: restriction endonuclease subunit S [Microcystis aeruginosa Ma_MB_S_20031200_S102]